MATTLSRFSDPYLRVPHSFRDPSGVLFFVDGTPIRLLRGSARDEIQAFLSSPTGMAWIQRSDLVATEFLTARDISALCQHPLFARMSAAEPWTGVVRHEAIPFPSFPEEWTPGMLHAAASLTLDLALDLLAD